MKKTKRILAWIGIILLVGMYIATLILAILDNSATMSMFKAATGCTILVPVLIYAYTLVYRILKPDNKEE